MKIFNFYDLELAEVIFDYMISTERYEHYLEYRNENDCSLAEFVEMFYLDDFKVYAKTLGYTLK